MTFRHQKNMKIYNSSLQQQKTIVDNNTNSKRMQTPHQSIDWKDKIILKSTQRRKSLNMHKKLQDIITQQYIQKCSQQLGQLIEKNTKSKTPSYKVSRNRSSTKNQLFVVPFLSLNSPLQSPTQQYTSIKKIVSQITSNPICKVQRSKTAKSRQHNNPSITNNMQVKKIVGIEYLSKKRSTIAVSKLIDDHKINFANSLTKKQQRRSFAIFLQQTCEKLGYSINTKLFIIQSQDPIVHRAFSTLDGWAENPNHRSLYFSIRWVDQLSPNIFKQSNKGQYLNRFKNLSRLINPFQRHAKLKNDPFLSKYYPKSYNLLTQEQQFLEQFRLISVFSLLKSHIEYIQSKNIVFKQIKSYNKSLSYIDLMLNSENFYSHNQNSSFLLSIPIAVNICMYLQNIKSAIEQENHHYYLREQAIQRMMRLQKVDTVFDALGNCQRLDDFPIIFSDNFNKFKCKNSFRTPSQQLISLIKLYYDYFKKQDCWSTSNLWILRSPKQPPIITQKLKTILSNKYQRIVQKYIHQNKLLNEVKQFENKPFTINYFILLLKNTVFAIYIYQDFYIKTSPQYHLPSHRPFLDISHSHILPSSKFQSIMKSKLKVNCKLVIQPKIQNIIKQYIGKQQFKSERNRFEIVEVEFMLTQRFHPYLLGIKKIQKFKNGIFESENIGFDIVKNTCRVLFQQKQMQKTKWKLIFEQKQNQKQG